jgi:hypothetical protein
MNPEENFQQPEFQQQAPAPMPVPPEPSSPAQPQKVHNPLEAMRPGEQVICEIKRHPIGIYGTYVMAGLLFVVALVAAIAAPMFIKSSAGPTSSLNAIVWGVSGLLILVSLIMLFVGTKVYWGNRWVVTSDSITQTLQNSLFDIQSSQLSMGNIEDVTVEMDGLLCHMFGFGLLRVETAGEHSKFVFPYCPSPNEYAKKILNCREEFEQGRKGDDQQRLYREQGAYAQQPYQQQPYPQQVPPQQPQYPMQPPQQQEQQIPPMPPVNPPYDNGGMPGQA